MGEEREERRVHISLTARLNDKQARQLIVKLNELYLPSIDRRGQHTWRVRNARLRLGPISGQRKEWEAHFTNNADDYLPELLRRLLAIAGARQVGEVSARKGSQAYRGLRRLHVRHITAPALE